MKRYEKHRLAEFMRAAGDPPMRSPDVYFGSEEDGGYPVLDGGEFSAEFSGPMAERFARHCRDLLRGAEIAKKEIERLREENDDLRGRLGEQGKEDPATIVDKKGEPLEVGDLVVYEDRHKPRCGLYLAVSTRSKAGDGWMDYKSLTSDVTMLSLRGEHAEKITSLTRSQYLPLAKRTLDPEMTKKERLSMLAFGLIGEWGELQKAIQEGDREKVLDECGDVLWYAEILYHEFDEEDDEYENVNLSGVRDWNRMSEQIKKEIFHGVGRGILWGMADDACASCRWYIIDRGGDIGKVRYRNIKKLIARYPDGFVEGGGER